jgi:hypothetical protein
MTGIPSALVRQLITLTNYREAHVTSRHIQITQPKKAPRDVNQNEHRIFGEIVERRARAEPAQLDGVKATKQKGRTSAWPSAFVRPSTPPAARRPRIAAAVTGSLWSMLDLVALINARESLHSSEWMNERARKFARLFRFLLLLCRTREDELRHLHDVRRD